MFGIEADGVDQEGRLSGDEGLELALALGPEEVVAAAEVFLVDKDVGYGALVCLFGEVGLFGKQEEWSVAVWDASSAGGCGVPGCQRRPRPGRVR